MSRLKIDQVESDDSLGEFTLKTTDARVHSIDLNAIKRRAKLEVLRELWDVLMQDVRSRPVYGDSLFVAVELEIMRRTGQLEAEDKNLPQERG